jgi:hypothetical protein
MTSHMAKGHKETHHILTKTTPHLASTILMKLHPAIRPTCHHQSITHPKYLREESSYVAAKATKDEAMMLATEMSRHGKRLVGMADPSKGNKIVMMMARDAAARKVRIVDPATTMTKGKEDHKDPGTHCKEGSHRSCRDQSLYVERKKRHDPSPSPSSSPHGGGGGGPTWTHRSKKILP